ncbi:cytochrome P450 3A2-like [Daphnia pulicaria]|uniref:cytochrome P450 3A2-like n=1 Tax=Daphnia pulicaria TaxID=35523 RepID=UPI001EEA90FA|nr:cytochrome P450 3A2-like [Daphnia pulicaria]
MDALEILSSPITWAVTVGTLYIFYRYVTSTFNYFSDQGIPGPKPMPFFGNMWGIWKSNLPEYDMSLVKKHGKVFGYYDGPQPNLWITDLELIKAIFVKDFDHFVDRRTFNFKTKIVRKWLTVVKGKEWKDIRSSVTPAFTTGKIKRMSLLIKECVEILSNRISAVAQSEGKMNAKLIYGAFTMDVIARCAFGLKIDSLGNKDDPFIKNAQFIFNPPTSKTPLILLPFMYPKLFSLVGESMFVTKQLKFFFELLQNILRERAQSKQKYHDFIEMAHEAISEFTKVVDGKTVPMWSPEEIKEIVIGQSTLFLLAGFDQTATTLTNTCFQLARNPDIQEKLHETILQKLEDYEDVCHEMVQDMPYLEQIIQEVLRFYPASLRTERMCTKDISYDHGGGRIHIKKGVLVTVPIYAVHHSEEYYPDPETFDPERWNPENKVKRNPYSFMAFGAGPRNCIGMRFAMEELKFAITTLVKQFRFFPVEETPEKLRFDVGFQPALQPMNAILGIELRQPN